MWAECEQQLAASCTAAKQTPDTVQVLLVNNIKKGSKGQKKEVTAVGFEPTSYPSYRI